MSKLLFLKIELFAHEKKQKPRVGYCQLDFKISPWDVENSLPRSSCPQLNWSSDMFVNRYIEIQASLLENVVKIENMVPKELLLFTLSQVFHIS